MPNDLYKKVNFSDGEGLVHTDLNNAQRFFGASVYDQLLSKLTGHTLQDFFEYVQVNTHTKWAYALSVGGALPQQGTANNKLKIGAGTLFQKIGNSDGNAETFLPYTFDGTLEFTIANGDATNPRVDMIQMKLELEDGDSQSRDFEDATTRIVTTTTPNKQRRVLGTFSVKQGTPAASPQYPTPDAGYVPICCVVVGANYTGAAAFLTRDSAGANAVIHDLRMPLSIQSQSVFPRDCQYDPTTWAPATAPDIQIRAGSTTTNYLQVPLRTRKCRILGLRINLFQGGAAFPANAFLGTYSSAGNAMGVKAMNLASVVNPGSGTANSTFLNFIGGSAPAAFSAGPTVQGTATYDIPVWGDGSRCYSSIGGVTGAFGAALNIEAALDWRFTSVSFHIATGL